MSTTRREIMALLSEGEYGAKTAGKGSHRNFVHPKVLQPITIAGQSSDDAKEYQIRTVRMAIEESRK